MARFGFDGILDRLSQLDDDLLALYPDAAPFELVIAGGSAIVLRGLAPTKTQTVDIDALRAADEVERLLARYDINTHVDTFKYRFPSHYGDRLAETPYRGFMLEVKTLSNEDLAITKLLAWREQDRDDLFGMVQAGNIDLDKLHAIADDIDEVCANLDAAEWADFLDRLATLESWAER